MKINQEVLAVLSTLQIEGNVVKIVTTLDRPLYMQTNKVLEALGGKWDRKAKGHVFQNDNNPEVRIESAILNEMVELPEKFGYFPTPKLLGTHLIELAELKEKMQVLEPSAGQGALADLITPIVGMESLTLFELQDSNIKVLEQKGYKISGRDFLTAKPEAKFDRIIMNPPFEHQADIDHVSHAFKFLKPGGKLVSIMASSITFRQNSKTTTFMEMLNKHGSYEANPENSFKSSGTAVNTVTIVLNKP